MNYLFKGRANEKLMCIMIIFLKNLIVYNNYFNKKFNCT